jgi:2-hydroxy-6-oxonona-2,4-dienedioate hydrolase
MTLRPAVLIVGLIVMAFAAVAVTVTFLARSEAAKRRATLAARSLIAATPFGQIEYTISGTGPAVLVLHGAGGGFDQGELLVEALAGGEHTWISVSRFGYLRSEIPDDASTSAQADALVNFLDQIGIERFSVLAMSGGVPPALQLAIRTHDRVEALVLLSSAPFTPFTPQVDGRPVPAGVYNAVAGNDVGYWLMSRIARSQLEAAFDARPELLGAAADDLFVRRLIETFPPASDRLSGLLNEAAAVDPDTVYDLESIISPVLLVHAEDDRINPVEIAENISKRIPSVRFLRLPSGGHLLLGHHAFLKAQVSGFLSFPEPT